MKRTILFISVSAVFLAFAAALCIAALSGKDRDLVFFLLPVVPLVFVSYWLIYAAIDERRLKMGGEYYSYHSPTSFGGFAFISKRHVTPFFLVMFGTVAISIAGELVAAQKSISDISWIVLAASFLYGLFITVYFHIKLHKSLLQPNDANEPDSSGTGIAVFFASVATLGLFYILWRMFLKDFMNRKN